MSHRLKGLSTQISSIYPVLTRFAKALSATAAAYFFIQLVRKGYYTVLFRYNKYPPGPIGVPFFGVLLSTLRWKDFTFAIKIGRQYPVMSMYPYGPWSYCVMVNDKDLIRKLSKSAVFSSRPLYQNDLMNNGHDINSPIVFQRRKLMMSAMCRMTDSRFFAEVVQRNIKDNILFPMIDESIVRGLGTVQPSDIWDSVFCVTFNTVHCAAFGLTLDARDELYLEFKRHSDTVTNYVLLGMALGVLAPNWVARFARRRREQQSPDDIMFAMTTIVKRWIDASQSQSRSPNSFIDLMMRNNFDEKTIMLDILTLFVNGSHTTCSSIVNQIYSLAKYPEIQHKIYVQLREIFQDADSLELSDPEHVGNVMKASLLRAFVEETWRLPVTQGGLLRELQQDVKVDFTNERGQKDYYMLPKGALVDFNGAHLVRTKANGFRFPLEFNIDNYIGTDGRFKLPIPSDVGVFGFGKRMCPGMTLARKETLFVIAFLVYHYRFSGPKGEGDVDFDVPIFFTKPTFPLCVSRRDT